MWGDRVGTIMDRSDGRATSGIARSGRLIGSGGSGSGTSHPVVAGGVDQRADCGGVLRAAGQRAALALDIRPGRGGRAARPHGARPRSGEGAGRLVGDRGSIGAGGVGAAELDLAAPGRRDREAHRQAHLDIAIERGAEKGGFRWRRPRHTLKGRQDADAVERSGLRLRLLRQQAKAGDVTLLFGDESEALTHPYLARAWAKRGDDLRVEAPGQSKKRAMIGALDCAAHQLIVNTSATKVSSDFIAFLSRLDASYGPCPGRPDKPVVFVLDNGPIHTSKASRAALAARDWLTIEWLPKYAPELNDIERSWRDLKAHFLAHQTFADIDHLDRAIHKGIADMNQERQLHLCTNLRIAA
jgi:transposase